MLLMATVLRFTLTIILEIAELTQMWCMCLSQYFEDHNHHF